MASSTDASGSSLGGAAGIPPLCGGVLSHVCALPAAAADSLTLERAALPADGTAPAPSVVVAAVVVVVVVAAVVEGAIWDGTGSLGTGAARPAGALEAGAALGGLGRRLRSGEALG